MTDPALAPVLAAIKPGPLTVAVALVAWLAWRWRRVSTENRVLAILAAAALVVYGSGVIHLPDLVKLIRGIGSALGPYTYAVVGVIAFLETAAFAGLVAPGELTVIFGGVVAGQGEISVVLLIGIVWACAAAGDTTSYVLGRRLGRDFLLRHGRRVKITPERLKQVEDFFDRYGGATIIVGRQIGLVRVMAPFVAGTSRMPFRRFIPYCVVSAGLWSATFCLLGYVFWQSFDQVVTLAKQGTLALGAVIATVVGGIALYRYLRVPENRRRAGAWIDRQAERPVLRPAARMVRPAYRHAVRPLARWSVGPARFVRDRLTPGELGLELTTLLAVALVGGYVFGALASDVGANDPFVADARAFDLLSSLRLGLADRTGKAVTALGSAQVTGAVLATAIVYLLARRKVLEAVTLGVGGVLTYFAVQVAKAAEARPRPAGGLIEVSSLSFPSGHAAYAITYVAVAAAIVHVLPHFVYRAALVVAAVVLAAVIGLSRVYLHVHYLSDVLAGWGLGLAIFAGCGLVAMIIGFIRQNRGSR
jgi:membrane protein DedA with SNARE-associated domain/membrane-associated phospholipid phosphatase